VEVGSLQCYREATASLHVGESSTKTAPLDILVYHLSSSRSIPYLLALTGRSITNLRVSIVFEAQKGSTSMATFFDAQRFTAQVRTKRGNRSLRSIAKEIGDISISTLSRIENGGIPDTETFLQLCAWLEASPGDFMKIPPTQMPEKSTVEQVILLLHMDTTLDAKIVEALVVLLQPLLAK